MDDLNLPEGWEVRKLGEVAESVNYGYTASAVQKGKIKFLRITDINGGIVNWEEVPFCKIEEKDIEKYKLQNGDIVVARTGNSTGENYFFDEDCDVVFASYLIRFRINRKLAHPKHVWYQMRSNAWWEYIKNVKSGSAQAGANAKVLSQFQVILPPLKEQQKIAEILSSLDEKIELNIKMNKTLEEMAKTIFKRWFIDFEFPNEEGKPYKSSGGEFINSELGEIPKGWRVEKLKNICLKLASGGTPSRKNENFFNGDILWAKTKELNDNYILDTEEKISEEALYKSSAKLFPKNSVVMAIYASPTVGKLGILSKEATFNQAACGMVVNEEMVSYEYLFLYLLSQREYLNNLASGAAQQNLNVSIVKNLDILIPKIDIIKKFKKIANPIFNQILNNQKEIQTLTKIRDTLLPKLITGKIRVRV
ncbi:restriction endonuclease subunit S [Methanothermococcus thermolithotrophicus]|uniref:restriction endonuclease subunit S n=1 Tax=Methanothermococcus thermolithotrophicus TaxID=2186 RepID=UPI00035FBA79|nr:restriction endonuclease subunit S [Methanothermococcus thermolithotrophicus]MDK2987320.1 type restriction enzyme subunit [Methanothermococcus sp.]